MNQIYIMLPGTYKCREIMLNWKCSKKTQRSFKIILRIGTKFLETKRGKRSEWAIIAHNQHMHNMFLCQYSICQIISLSTCQSDLCIRDYTGPESILPVKTHNASHPKISDYHQSWVLCLEISYRSEWIFHLCQANLFQWQKLLYTKEILFRWIHRSKFGIWIRAPWVLNTHQLS